MYSKLKMRSTSISNSAFESLQFPGLELSSGGDCTLPKAVVTVGPEFKVLSESVLVTCTLSKTVVQKPLTLG